MAVLAGILNVLAVVLMGSATAILWVINVLGGWQDGSY
jgi:hypothetical protein